MRLKLSKIEIIFELIVCDNEWSIECNSSSMLLLNMVLVSAFLWLGQYLELYKLP